MINNLTSDEYIHFFTEIKNKIRNSQYGALKVVNKTLITLYWEIGREIYLKQQEKGWGKSVVEILAKELQTEFPNVKGFSARNLWRMSSFYKEYSSTEFPPPLVVEISWAKKYCYYGKIQR